MMKKIIGWMLITVMLFSAIAVSAEETTVKPPFTNSLTVGYLPGDTHKVVTKDDIIATDGAEVSGNGVQISAGGSATFGFSSRFAMRSVTLKFEGASGTTTIDTGDNLYTVTDLAGDGEYVLVFGENLGYAPQPYLYNNETVSGYYREYLELKGEKEVKVSTTGGMYLKEMSFEKDKTPVLKNIGTPNMTAEEKTIMTTVALDEKASVILVNGARRYLDNNDTNTRPYEQNGTLYIPINTLARALGYYVEDYPEKQYALLRSDTHDYVMLEGKHYVTTGLSDPVEPPFEAIIYRDGKTLAALRYFAELMGETVIYDKGLIIIDDKYVANDLVSDETMRSYIAAKLTPFKVEETVGKTYYVAQNGGSDENLGTSLAPFKTIGKAASLAAAGDTVIVRGGTYRETLTPANSGTENAPITFKAAEGEKVVISALEEFDTWAQLEDGKYMTKMPWDLGKTRNMLFIDGEPLTEARHPNTPGVLPGESIALDNNLWPVRGDMFRVPGTGENLNLVRSATQLWQEEEDYWKGGVYVGLNGYAYNLQSATIESSKPGELKLGPDKTAFWYTVKDSGASGDGLHYNWGYIVGHINALDAPGEWYRADDGLLYAIFPEGRTPENSKIEAKQRQLVIDLNARQFVNVEGFETIGGGARMNYSVMCMINGCDMKYISHSIHTADQHAGYIDFDLSKGLDKNGYYQVNRVDTNGAPQRGEVGVYIAGRDNIFVNSKINGSGYAGLYLTGLYTYAENNDIGNTGYAGSCMAGINIISVGTESQKVPRGGHAIFNNSVYNVGRTPITITRVTNPKEAVDHCPFLPSDIGYNDFRDGMLMSADTGLTYQYQINAGYDGLMTNEHHNYVYTTVNKTDYNPYSNGIYHDGQSFGVDSFKNQVFWTQPGGRMSGKLVFMQPHNVSPANYLSWDNGGIGDLVEGGVDAMRDHYFTEDKPYWAGYLGDKDYTLNYDRFKAGMFGMQYTASDAELSDGVTVNEAGYAEFTEDGQYIKFSDVDFGDGCNKLAISTRGQYTHTNDKLEVIIDNLESGEVYEFTIKNDAPETDIPTSFRRTIKDISGKHDVYVRVKDYYSTEFGGLSVYNVESSGGEEYAYTFYPGNFDEAVKFDPSPLVEGVPEGKSSGAVDPGSAWLNGSWPGYYVVYKDREFTEETDAFMMAAGSGSIYAFQNVEVYVDGIEEEDMVCKFRCQGVGWTDRTPQVTELNRVISKGTHDIYLKFPADDGYSKSSNIYEAGFVKKGVVIQEVADARIKVYGQRVDTSISKQSDIHPFRIENMNPPNFNLPGLTYTLPGTVAGFKDVDITIEAGKFVMNYAAEPGVDGQPIEVRLGSLDSEPIATFVTEGLGMMKFNMVTIDLEEPIQPGKYDVYISFGGDANARLNTKLDWFGFNY
ncbi:MAG: carbohydrate-binding protein [Clostridia bacterium]|nr:carbohydrate-binding protein [Clostridia bacterium]